MKKIVCIAVVFAAVVASAGAMYISQDAAKTGSILTQLKLQPIPGKPGVMGAPEQYKITDETIKYLQQMQKDGKVVEVQSNGEIKILDKAK
jgi:phage terminase large subunit-like protein